MFTAKIIETYELNAKPGEWERLEEWGIGCHHWTFERVATDEGGYRTYVETLTLLDEERRIIATRNKGTVYIMNASGATVAKYSIFGGAVRIDDPVVGAAEPCEQGALAA